MEHFFWPPIINNQPYIYIYIWVNLITTEPCSPWSLVYHGFILGKPSPSMAELFRLVKYYNLPRLMMVQPISWKNISGWVENKKTPVVHCVFFKYFWMGWNYQLELLLLQLGNCTCASKIWSHLPRLPDHFIPLYSHFLGSRTILWR